MLFFCQTLLLKSYILCVIIIIQQYIEVIKMKNQVAEDKKQLKENKADQNNVNVFACPDCGAKLVHEGGCVFCPFCGYSECQ
ncbi:hypothetical protein Teth39_0987 [Thermoanaerobacter pseudethanolicus ATCC 33223]|jgi:rubrerythrin|uniref:Uncharacterized protein n=2 Tax=Thermoanaerobacter TaxID=1754 RepID=B0K929_THEP3|nr:hypothetical protein Teth514_1428 [Thermoanaerobacter sp. X514]ABY94642.1 hypothetical protein Teth39_0987 [Thermoanaerobacter pseudethanolicus ATCC 33223]